MCKWLTGLLVLLMSSSQFELSTTFTLYLSFVRMYSINVDDDNRVHFTPNVIVDSISLLLLFAHYITSNMLTNAVGYIKSIA